MCSMSVDNRSVPPRPLIFLVEFKMLLPTFAYKHHLVFSSFKYGVYKCEKVLAIIKEVIYIYKSESCNSNINS